MMRKGYMIIRISRLLQIPLKSVRGYVIYFERVAIDFRTAQRNISPLKHS